MTDMLYIREIAEKLLRTLLLMFKYSHRERVTEKEFDIAIQMTLEHVSSEIQENRKN